MRILILRRRLVRQYTMSKTVLTAVEQAMSPEELAERRANEEKVKSRPTTDKRKKSSADNLAKARAAKAAKAAEAKIPKLKAQIEAEEKRLAPKRDALPSDDEGDDGDDPAAEAVGSESDEELEELELVPKAKPEKPKKAPAKRAPRAKKEAKVAPEPPAPSEDIAKLTAAVNGLLAKRVRKAPAKRAPKAEPATPPSTPAPAKRGKVLF